MTSITVYGADWCPLTKRTLEHLRRTGVEYDYIDIERDAAARKWVRDHNHGKERKPTVSVGGQTLTEPSNEALDRAIKQGTT